jgi:hypothetical protein
MPRTQVHPCGETFSKLIATATVLTALLMAAACNSSSPSNGSSGNASERQPPKASNAANSSPGIDLNCVIDHLQNPPESFHYLYKKQSSSPVHQEADITPQTIDGFRADPDGSQQPLHATRSDQQSWQMALTSLTGISGMSSTVAMINHNSAMQRESDGGQVNGYDTIHYSIDTARFTATERQMLLSPGEFEKGDAWVTSAGCPVKLTLDTELHRKDGSLIEKLHYELAMVKK